MGRKEKRKEMGMEVYMFLNNLINMCILTLHLTYVYIRAHKRTYEYIYRHVQQAIGKAYMCCVCVVKCFFLTLSV